MSINRKSSGGVGSILVKLRPGTSSSALSFCPKNLHSRSSQWTLMLLAVGVLSACSTVRVDSVESERFDVYPCSDSELCAVDPRIVVLERNRVVSGGVARNTAGTLSPGCTREGKLYTCVSREYVYELPVVDELESATLFRLFTDGYESRSVTPSPSKCEIVTTKKAANPNYRAVDQYFNFGSADALKTQVFDRTGSALEDHTAVIFQCKRDCAYTVKTNQWTNQIDLVLSKSRISGRLAPEEKQVRAEAVQTFLTNCQSEGV